MKAYDRRFLQEMHIAVEEPRERRIDNQIEWLSRELDRMVTENQAAILRANRWRNVAWFMVGAFAMMAYAFYVAVRNA